MLFRGRILRSLDAKGRVMFPPDFRETLLARADDGKFALTTYDSCIVGYPLPDFIEFEKKLDEFPNPPRKLRDFRRRVVGGAEVMVPDAQGRVRLSRYQMNYAGITDEVVLMGQGKRFELWEPSRLEAILNEDFDDIASYVGEGFEFFL